MRNFVVKAFENYVVGTSNVYTPTSVAELLGSADRLCCTAVVYRILGTTPRLTIQFEHSFDGTRWLNQNTTPELNAFEALGGIGNIALFSSTRIPTLNYVRLRIALTGTTPSANLAVWICGRSPNR